jgi:uncharacterized protein YgbK (DUF1537 family)
LRAPSRRLDRFLRPASGGWGAAWRRIGNAAGLTGAGEFMGPKLGIIADVVTGALLVAGQLESVGIAAPVFLDPAGLAEGAAGQIPILAARTRLLPVQAALDRVTAGAAALGRAGCPRLLYKVSASFDSTEFGNIGPVGEHLAQLSGGAPILMSAGFPRHDSTVHQGYLFYQGRLVSESIKRFDPLTPMADPDLVRFLSRQTQGPVALLPHRVLRAGSDAVWAEWQRLIAQGSKHILADTSDDADVAATVALALESGAMVVASDAVTIALSEALVARTVEAKRAADPSAVLPPDGPGAVLVGSVGPKAMAQFARLAMDHPVLTVDPMDPRSEEASIAAAVAWAAGWIDRDRAFGIGSVMDPEGVERAQAALGRIGAARKVERLLAGIAVGIVAQGVRRLVVSGGETSGAIVEALGILRARAMPAGELGGGFCTVEAPVPIALFLKSGKLGAEDVFGRALAAMRQPARRP